MDVASLLKELKLDSWYKATLVVAVAAFFVAILAPVRGITNRQLLLLASGVVLISLGEWKNHVAYSAIKPANAYTGGPALITVTSRRWTAFGTLLQVIGVILLIFFCSSTFAPVASPVVAPARDATPRSPTPSCTRGITATPQPTLTVAPTVGR